MMAPHFLCILRKKKPVSSAARSSRKTRTAIDEPALVVAGHPRVEGPQRTAPRPFVCVCVTSALSSPKRSLRLVTQKNEACGGRCYVLLVCVWAAEGRRPIGWGLGYALWHWSVFSLRPRSLFPLSLEGDVGSCCSASAVDTGRLRTTPINGCQINTRTRAFFA